MDQNFLICHTFQLRLLLDLNENACRKLKVPDQIINEDKEALKQAQATDPNLDSIRGRVESGSITVSRGLNRGETKFVRKKGLLYRQFTKGNKVTLQLVIPVGFREKVLRLAHETLLTEHLGIKKTLDRVVSEFFWPGVCFCLFVCLFVLRFNVPVNNFSVMSGRSHRFLGNLPVLSGSKVSCSRTQHGGGRFRTPDLSLRSPTLYH